MFLLIWLQVSVHENGQFVEGNTLQVDGNLFLSPDSKWVKKCDFWTFVEPKQD